MNSHAARHRWVLDAPDEMIDDLADQHGKVHVDRRRRVIEIVVNDRIVVAEYRLEVPARMFSGLAQSAEKGAAEMIDWNIESRGRGVQWR